MSYKKAGVDIDAADRFMRRIGPIAQKTARPGLLAGVGGFSALFELRAKRYREPVLVSSTDGVGTKLRIAGLLGVHDTIGIDLVAMGVNDILTQAAEPLFFLDYFATGKLKPAIALEVIRGIAHGCKLAQCALVGGETAEMPSFYRNGEYDLAGFAVGVVEKKEIPDPKRISAGDFLVGFPSSGLHSNGFSLARRVLLEGKKIRLSARLADLGRPLGEELLEPTRIYTQILRPLFPRRLIKAAAHITGGGVPGNLPRVLPAGRGALIRRGSWPVHPIFAIIQKCGRVPLAEMDRTFNNGLGMIAVVGGDRIDLLAQRLKRMREKYFVIGEIVKGDRGVTYSS
ncbi:MAG: phosphoribosylformylglycinamidine cyclo-ligase [Candidatus Binatia bacterium]